MPRNQRPRDSSRRCSPEGRAHYQAYFSPSIQELMS